MVWWVVRRVALRGDRHSLRAESPASLQRESVSRSFGLPLAPIYRVGPAGDPGLLDRTRFT